MQTLKHSSYDRLLIICWLLFAPVVLFAQQNVIAPRAVDGSKYVYMNIVVNSHDFSQVRTSYSTLSRLFSIYRKYGVIADFYFTDQLAQRLEWSYPGFLDSLRRTGMGINIHHRAPHALTFRPSRREAQNPQQGIITLFRQGKTEEAFAECERWERRRVNVATGGLDSAVGGYDFIEQRAGTKPVCVGFGISGNFDGDSLAIGAMLALKKYGLRATVDEHEGGADPVYPFMSIRGVLARPADSSITRWAAGTMKSDTFWWKMVLTPNAEAYNPRTYLAQQMATVNRNQLTLMNTILHETDFSYDRPPFYSVYYVSGTSGATNPVPYDTTAFPTERVIPWSEAQKAAIWSKYDSLIQYIAGHPNIRTITMQSLLTMLADDRERSVSREQCRNLASQILSSVQGSSFRMPSKNFFSTSSTDFFSLADAYYALQRSLAEFARAGRVLETLTLRDVAPPLGAGAGLTATFSVPLSDALAVVRAQDSIIAQQTAQNRYGGLMPITVGIGGRTVNMVEYLVLLARMFQAANGGTASSSIGIEVRQVAVPPTLTPPSGSAPSQNGPTNWTVKPFRRIKLSPDAATTPVSVRETDMHHAEAVLTIHPNPAQNELVVRYTFAKPEASRIVLYNTFGQEIFTTTQVMTDSGEYSLTLNPATVPNGLYFVRLYSGMSVQTQPVWVVR